MLANGDFARGLDRWIFTDDSHVSWRMLNQYLMAWFETGALGLAAFCLLAGVAIVGGIRALGRGVMAASAVVGGVTSFMVSSLFDNVLEAPRLALLFFLVSWCGLLQWQSGRQ
jgi:O-antigen ligase